MFWERTCNTSSHQVVPVSFQLFTNNNFGKKDITRFSCSRYVHFRNMIVRGNWVKNFWMKCLDLEDTKREAMVKLYPLQSTNDTAGKNKTYLCTMMLLSNFYTPEWVNMDCDAKITSIFFCEKMTQVLQRNLSIVNKYSFCQPQFLLFNNSCFLLQAVELQKSASKLCSEIQLKLALFSPYINEIMPRFALKHLPPVFGLPFNFGYKSGTLLFEENQNISTEGRKHVLHTDNDLLAVCSTPVSRKESKLKYQVFPCKAGGLVSILLLCNGNNDCPYDASDEENCICVQENNSSPSLVFVFCHLIRSPGKPDECGPLFFRTKQGSCVPFYFEPPSLKNDTSQRFTKYFECNAEKLIENRAIANDLIPDCGPKGEDEPLLKALLTYATRTSCQNLNHLPCFEGHPKCFNISELCSFTLSSENHLQPCRNGGHLKNCSAFECNAQYKCPNSYCIPFSYVCDGIWHCPEGADESVENRCGYAGTHCKGMFKCNGVQFRCVHLGNICDGIVHCPVGEDEIMCELDTCPKTCVCFAYKLYCFERNFSQIQHHYLYKFLEIIHCQFPDNHLLSFFEHFAHAISVKLYNSKIVHICQLKFQDQLTFVSFAFNKIVAIAQSCFEPNKGIKAMRLDNNKIHILGRKCFGGLNSVQLLNISENPISVLGSQLLSRSHKMFGLFLHFVSDSQIDQISLHTFRGTKFRAVVSNHHQICCLPNSQDVCFTKSTPGASCQTTLLPSVQMWHSMVVVSILVFIANISSLSLQHLDTATHQSFSFTLSAICQINFLCCIYLVTIWSADVHFGSVFFLQEKYWRSSVACFSAVTNLNLFIILAVALGILQTTSRLLVVVSPVDTSFKRSKYVIRCILSLSILSLLIVVPFTISVKITSETFPTTFCVLFLAESNDYLLFSVAVWLLSCLQMIACLVVIILRLLLIIEYVQSQKTITKSNTSSTNKAYSLIGQLSVLSLTNVLCWFPASVVYISALFASSYPTETVAWVMVISTPINAVLCPIIFGGVTVRNILLAARGPPPGKAS